MRQLFALALALSLIGCAPQKPASPPVPQAPPPTAKPAPPPAPTPTPSSTPAPDPNEDDEIARAAIVNGQNVDKNGCRITIDPLKAVPKYYPMPASDPMAPVRAYEAPGLGEWLGATPVGGCFDKWMHAINGTPPYTWKFTGPVQGLTLWNGHLRGTPTVPGDYIVAVTIRDAAGGEWRGSWNYRVCAAGKACSIGNAP